MFPENKVEMMSSGAAAMKLAYHNQFLQMRPDVRFSNRPFGVKSGPADTIGALIYLN
jgi:hypothetical protein